MSVETIKFLFWGYVSLVTSWWWLVLGAITVFWSVVILLKDYDSKLTTRKAIKLTVIGVLDTIPFVKKLLPDIVTIDFLTRWMMLNIGCSFRPFLFIFSLLSFFLAPVLFLLLFRARLLDLWDDFMKTEQGAELRNRGLGATIKMWLRG